MRTLIDLVETARLDEGHGVDPRSVILRMCVAVFTGRTWDRRPHIKHLENDDAFFMWRDFLRGDLPDAVRDLDFAEARETPEFTKLILKWAQARYHNVEQKLADLPRGGHGVKISRIMRVPLEKFEQARRDGHADLGVHWTFAPDDWDFYVVWGQDNPGVDVIIEAEAPDSSIDWFNTYLSNMDYESGDTEDELRVLPDAPIHVHRAYVADTEADIDIRGIRFTA